MTSNPLPSPSAEANSFPVLPYDRKIIYEYGKVSPLRILLLVLVEWVLIIFSIAACHHYFSPILYLLVVVFIAGRQHALGVLLHEIAHYHLSRKHKTFNDIVGDIFLAFPLFVSVHGYRRQHFQHHRSVGTSLDPDWARTQNGRFSFPKSRFQLLVEAAKCIGGYYSLHDSKEALIDQKLAIELPLSVHLLRGLFFAAVVGAMAYWNLWWSFLLYWLIPLNTFLVFFLYWRLVAEHSAISKEKYLNTRTVKAGLLEEMVIFPHSVNYHLEHHLFPNVPCYKLKELHRYLMTVPQFLKNAQITDGYFSGLCQELVRNDQMECSPAVNADGNGQG